jgi:DNA-binding CsgD family transcriptional regulator
VEYLNALPKSDLLILLEIIHNVKAVRNIAQLECCMSQLNQLLLFDGACCILSDMDTIQNGKPIFCQKAMNFPEGFVDHYVKHGHYSKSPVLQASFKTNYPINWKTIWGHKTRQRSKHTMEFARAFGFLDGWIATHRYENDPSVAVFMVAGKKVETGQRAKAILKCVSTHFSESVMDIFHYKLRTHKRNRYYKLTPRELEVLEWIMDGKTTLDISIIFNRSERVVKWHVKNILQKLGAQSRTHAVAIAMRQGVI